MLRGSTATRHSTDGLTFARAATFTFGGAPELARATVTGHPIICDPSLVAGAGLFVFKTGGRSRRLCSYL